MIPFQHAPRRYLDKQKGFFFKIASDIHLEMYSENYLPDLWKDQDNSKTVLFLIGDIGYPGVKSHLKW